jgi:hypothetical protein
MEVPDTWNHWKLLSFVQKGKLRLREWKLLAKVMLQTRRKNWSLSLGPQTPSSGWLHPMAATQAPDGFSTLSSCLSWGLWPWLHLSGIWVVGHPKALSLPPWTWLVWALGAARSPRSLCHPQRLYYFIYLSNQWIVSKFLLYAGQSAKVW